MKCHELFDRADQRLTQRGTIADALFQADGVKDHALSLAVDFGIDAADKLAAVQDRHDIIAEFAFGFWRVDLDAIMKIPEHKIARPIPEQIVKGREEDGQPRRMLSIAYLLQRCQIVAVNEGASFQPSTVTSSASPLRSISARMRAVGIFLRR